MVQAPEPAVFRDWPEHGFPRGTYGPIPQAMVERAEEQLEGLVQILKRRGIQVDRPTAVDFRQRVSTPEWTQGSMFGCMPIGVQSTSKSQDPASGGHGPA